MRLLSKLEWSRHHEEDHCCFFVFCFCFLVLSPYFTGEFWILSKYILLYLEQSTLRGKETTNFCPNVAQWLITSRSSQLHGTIHIKTPHGPMSFWWSTTVYRLSRLGQKSGIKNYFLSSFLPYKKMVCGLCSSPPNLPYLGWKPILCEWPMILSGSAWVQLVLGHCTWSIVCR